MKTRTLYILLIGCFSFGSFSVLALFLAMNNFNHRNNSFVRLYPSGVVKQNAIMDIKYNSYYIAGVGEEKIYLGNVTAPLHLLVLNSALTDSQHVKLSLRNLEDYNLNALRLKVEEPYFYLTDGSSMPGLFRGKIGLWVADRFMYDSVYFTDIKPIGSETFALVALRTANDEYTLGKLKNSPPNFEFFPGLLEKQIDGKFCVDGMLHYDKKSNRIIYLYYYRNQYIVSDTNMNLLYRGKTIDTTSFARIKVARIESQNALTMAAPPHIVNRRSCVFGNLLFVHSNSMAKNEVEVKYKHGSAIDVYDLTDKTYRFSFYLMDYEHNKLKDFRIEQNFLYALFDHYIIKYEFKDAQFVSSHP